MSAEEILAREEWKLPEGSLYGTWPDYDPGSRQQYFNTDGSYNGYEGFLRLITYPFVFVNGVLVMIMGPF